MKRLGILLFVIVLTSMIGCSNASKESSVKKLSKEVVEKITNEELDKYFTGVDGCFILFDQNKGEYSVYNEAKSKKQVSPCSTFKIFNSLIGLETNVLQGEKTTFKWDGTKYQIESWNKDQTLKSAVSNSVVWYFQKVASQVGKEKMQVELRLKK